MLSIYEERGIIKGLRNAALRVLRARFGDLPERVEARIHSITDEDELNTLVDRAANASSLADMGLGDSGVEEASNGSEA